jgi:cytochrome P450
MAVATEHPAGWSPEVQWAAVERGETHDIAAIYQAQRERCPVAWRAFEDGQGFWTVFNYADVDYVLTHPELFSSAVPKYGIQLIPIEVDPPEHPKYRMLLSKLINPGRMKRFDGQIREFLGAEMGRLAKGETDLLAMTSALPVQTFCFMMGEEDPNVWKSISARREANNDPRLSRLDEETTAKRQAANQPLVDYCAAQIAAHRAQPQDDIVSDVLAGEIDGRPITDDEALRMISLIYIAGHRTTTAVLRGAVVQLGRRPDVQNRLRADLGRIPTAIEEFVRLETPIHALPRYALKDVELGGQLIRKGEQVFPNYGAANVDPTVFPNPGDMDVERKPNRHVGFGRGIHNCAGAPVARLQLRIFLEELLQRTKSLQLSGPVQRMTWPHYGPVTLPTDIEFNA